MENQFVSYDITLKLKELGFNEPCFGKFYTKPNCKMFGVDEKGRHYPIKNTPKKLYTLGEHFVLNESNVINAYLYQQVFEFFRSKQLQSHISFGLVFSFVINNQSYEDYPNEGDNWFRTYHEAQIACINKLIELIYDK